MYTLDNVLVTAGGITKSIAQWQADDPQKLPTTAVTNSDGSIVFAFDDPTGFPGDVVVYINGR